MTNHRRLSPALLASAAVAAALVFGALATSAQAALRHVDGTVVSKDPGSRTFKISTQSGSVRVSVNAGTEFERIPGGFGGLKKGMRIEVDAQRTGSGLVAKQVEPQAGGGGGGDDGGGHHGGHDDGLNHT